MPFQREWPFWVSDRVVADRRAALEELERASGDLKETKDKAIRTHEVAASLRESRRRNHFSTSMEELFATVRHPASDDPRNRR
jgi:hypothetical protein